MPTLTVDVTYLRFARNDCCLSVQSDKNSLRHYFRLIKPEYITSKHSFFLSPFSLRSPPLDFSLPKNPRALPHTHGTLAINIHSRRGSGVWGCTIFQEFPGTERLARSTSGNHAKLTLIPRNSMENSIASRKRGVDRYYEDHVSWQSAEKRNVWRAILYFIFFTTSYFILNVKLFIPFIASRNLAWQYSALMNSPFFW